MSHPTRLSKQFILSSIRWRLVVSLFFGMAVSFYPVQAIGGGGYGPGGVGSIDGTSNLKLWLKADEGVYTDDGCTTAAGNGNSVACWADQSGSSNHFTQVTPGYRPAFAVGVLNNMPALQFNGIGQFLEKSLSSDLNASNYTIFIVAHVTGNLSTYQSPFFSRCGTDKSTYSGYNLFSNTDNIWQLWASNTSASDGWSKLSGPDVSDLSWRILTGHLNSNEHALYADNTWQESDEVNFRANSGCPTRIGWGNPGLDPAIAYFNGEIAEIIYFNIGLNSVQRNLVNNYLGAKYDISVEGNKYIDNDPAFIMDVAGIGKESDGAHNNGASAGMSIADQSFLVENGHYILIGHNGTANNNTTDDIPSGGIWTGGGQRWTRTWYLSKTDENESGGLVDITFDISESGMGGSFAGNTSNYRLLKRIGTSGAFSDIATAASISGDQVLFDNVNVSLLGSYFTLGTVDTVNSPTAVTLQDFRGGQNNIARVMALVLLAVLIGLILGFLTLQNRYKSHI